MTIFLQKSNKQIVIDCLRVQSGHNEGILSLFFEFLDHNVHQVDMFLLVLFQIFWFDFLPDVLEFELIWEFFLNLLLYKLVDDADNTYSLLLFFCICQNAIICCFKLILSSFGLSFPCLLQISKQLVQLFIFEEFSGTIVEYLFCFLAEAYLCLFWVQEDIGVIKLLEDTFSFQRLPLLQKSVDDGEGSVEVIDAGYDIDHWIGVVERLEKYMAEKVHSVSQDM